MISDNANVRDAVREKAFKFSKIRVEKITDADQTKKPFINLIMHLNNAQIVCSRIRSLPSPAAKRKASYGSIWMFPSATGWMRLKRNMSRISSRLFPINSIWRCEILPNVYCFQQLNVMSAVKKASSLTTMPFRYSPTIYVHSQPATAGQSSYHWDGPWFSTGCKVAVVDATGKLSGYQHDLSA